MKKLIITTTSLIFILLLSSFMLPQSSWKLSKNKNGIKIHTRPVKGSKLKEYKVSMEVTTTVAKVKKVIMDIPKYTEWQHNCTTSKVLKTVNQNELYTYQVINAPWPVSDRDNSVVLKLKDTPDGGFKVEMINKPNYIKKQGSNVRVDYIKGYWKVTPKAGGKVEILQQVHASPGGSIPAWLANSAVVDTPYNTFKAMKTRL